MEIRENLEELIRLAIENAIENKSLPLDEIPDPALERPRDEANGDWASTVALRCAKSAKMSPRDVASIIVSNLTDSPLIKSIDIAGPGFINITLKNSVLQDTVREIRELSDNYGRGNIDKGAKKINLEYISANPTGPMHVGHGRWATLGDSMARVMRHAGYDVYEEFYINDHGNQMNVFGASVSVRYMQLLGYDEKMPEECYGGEYVKDIAQSIINEHGTKYVELSPDERSAQFRDIAYRMMLADQQLLLKEYGVTFDRWFSESDLYKVVDEDKSAIDIALAAMDERGYIYQSEGATWFRSTEFGDEKDRVLIKKDGEYTYFMSDVAYHYNKVQRGFDKLIDIWGADHHGYIKRCEAMLAAWGYPDKLEVVLGQLVNLFRDGKPVRMSKRTGEMVTFQELIEEVGVDATRYLMLSRSSDQQIDFDIDLAKKKDSSNPVYYVQYAHARICSIIRKSAGMEDNAASDSNIDDIANKLIPTNVDLSVLSDESELALIKAMAEFPELITLAARDRAPFRLTHYAERIASLFHGFYTNCKVICDDNDVMNARLALCDATRILIRLTLGLMGVSAPAKM